MAANEKLPLLSVDDDDEEVPNYSSRSLIPHSLGPHYETDKLTICGDSKDVITTEQDSIVAIFVVAFDTRSGRPFS